MRQLLGCIGLSGDISILRDFLGFSRGRVPPAPAGAKVEISLLRQAQLLQGRHYHLNVTAVGADNFTDAEDRQIDYSIYRIRDIYNQVGVGVGRVQHWDVNTADADGLDAPTTTDQLEEITDRWTVGNDGIDVFVPLSMNVTIDGSTILGQSARPGPCEEKDDKGMNGAVVGLWGSAQTARTFAHEVGHYLGLEHTCPDDAPCTECPPDRLMTQSRCASNTLTSVNLTSEEGDTVEDHCLVKPGC